MKGLTMNPDTPLEIQWLAYALAVNNAMDAATAQQLHESPESQWIQGFSFFAFWCIDLFTHTFTHTKIT